jgi:hypothetical protein
LEPDQGHVTVLAGSPAAAFTTQRALEPPALNVTAGLKTAVIQIFDAEPPAWLT